MQCIKDISFSELENFIVERGYDKFRAKQILHGVFVNRATDFEQISTLPKQLRRELSEKFYINNIKNCKYQTSQDGTVKFLFQLRNGSAIESVFIPWDKGLKERKTLCVSSQVGCALGCSFCATGKLGLKRNLTVGEILDQIFECERIIGSKLTNIVFMGMGEPLQNFQNLLKALSILTDENWKLFSRKNITVSTSGVVPKIYELAKIERPVKLAISLHSTDEELRSQLMPIARKWKLKELRDAAIFYYRTTKIPITYEFILFDGLNDGEEEVRRLAKFARAVPSKVNIIPFHRIDFVPLNEFERTLRPARFDKILKFKEMLRSQGVPTFIRSSSGYDINGACGQLAFANYELIENFQ
ncbi:MAG: putative dual-specificity RNA methyltransferase RlmN [Candidatus Kapaibacterium sp.]|nr:MAG: putative dual-specificity RNA methyltransferase RlmN [Candidatus Kapabacteria bacterium]